MKWQRVNDTIERISVVCKSITWLWTGPVFHVNWTTANCVRELAIEKHIQSVSDHLRYIYEHGLQTTKKVARQHLPIGEKKSSTDTNEYKHTERQNAVIYCGRESKCISDWCYDHYKWPMVVNLYFLFLSRSSSSSIYLMQIILIISNIVFYEQT